MLWAIARLIPWEKELPIFRKKRIIHKWVEIKQQKTFMWQEREGNKKIVLSKCRGWEDIQSRQHITPMEAEDPIFWKSYDPY